MMKIFHSDRFVPRLPDGHRFPIQKYQLIREQLLYEGTLTEDQLEEATPISEEEVLRVHDRSYWSHFTQLTLDPRAVRKIGFPQSAELVDRSRRSCQGTLGAALHALEYGVAGNIAGGTHHAYEGHGEGFCLLNDLVITAKHLLFHKHAKRILIVDLDVHQGNGTAKMCADDSRIFTFSMHGAQNYPLRKEVSDLDIPLDTFTEDPTYLALLRETLPKLIDQHMPDFILYQAGVDVLATDKLGKLNLTHRGCQQRDAFVLETAYQHQIPLAICIGGGYSERVADTVEAHARTFRTAVHIFA
ncbi:MAG: histone deacetylase [Bacteroidota bacterium]